MPIENDLALKQNMFDIDTQMLDSARQREIADLGINVIRLGVNFINIIRMCFSHKSTFLVAKFRT